MSLMRRDEEAPRRAEGLDVLIVDDEEVVRGFLKRWLELGGARCRMAPDGEAGVAAATERAPDVVFLDVRLPGIDGLEVLRRLRALSRPPEVALMSAYADVGVAVQGFRDGACDLLQKPFTIARLSEALEVIEARRAAASRAGPAAGPTGAPGAAAGPAPAAAPGAAGGADEPPPLVAVSAPMRKVAGMVERIAPTDATVLIEGETGTGKEVVARTLHARSGRRGGPFLAVNCGAIPESLIEAELFGHEPGAFTGAIGRRPGFVRAAQGGTLFLDEVGELTLAAQVKLLRVLQERTVIPVGATAGVPVDVRVVAATNRDLAGAVKSGEFRQDLFFRLDVVRIVLPPLRKRAEDLPQLVQRLLERHAPRYGRAVGNVEPDALEALKAYAWPGNVRELENVLERAMALGADGAIGTADLPAHVLGGDATAGEDSAAIVAASAAAPAVQAGAGTAARAVPSYDDAERSLFQSALAATGGNREKAARLLGVSSKTVSRKIKRYGL